MKQKIGRSYIKCRLKWIAAVTGCGIVMTAVLFLNEVPAGEIAYGMLLCLGILLLAVTMDRISYGRRHRELFALRQSITVSLENLPEPAEILEEDYQQLLGLLAEEKMRIWNTAVSEKRDLMEYYTMWVHQIKTPIAALKLLIEEEADIPGEEEPLGEDRESLQQQREKRRDEELQQLFAIEQYVNMALSYMRLGSETTDFVLRQTDLDEVIRMAVRRYARHFISKKITLHYEETGARVLTDENGSALSSNSCCRMRSSTRMRGASRSEWRRDALPLPIRGSEYVRRICRESAKKAIPAITVMQTRNRRGSGFFFAALF